MRLLAESGRSRISRREEGRTSRAAVRAKRFSLFVSTPDVPMIRSVPFNAASRLPTVRADSRISIPRIARCRASSAKRQGFTRTSSVHPKFFIPRATAPTFPSFFGSTRTTRNVGTLRSIYCNGDMPWHASRAQDCVRWRRVLRPPAPTGSADRRGRVPRGIAGGQGRPGSALVVLSKREPNGSGRERRRKCDRVRFGPPTRRGRGRVQQPCTRRLGMGMLGCAADVPSEACHRTLVSLPLVRRSTCWLAPRGGRALLGGPGLSLLHV